MQHTMNRPTLRNNIGDTFAYSIKIRQIDCSYHMPATNHLVKGFSKTFLTTANQNNSSSHTTTVNSTLTAYSG